MRHTILFFCLCLHAATIAAMGRYQPGDTLYVWAVNGLTLRNAPHLGGGKLATLPYGARLVAQNAAGDHTTRVAVASAHANVLVLRGDFTMVTYNGSTGFVFDGYLSRLPPFQRSFSPDWPEEPMWEGHLDWAIRCFNLQRKTVTGNPVAGAAHACQWIFGNGIIIDVRVEKGGETRIILPDVSMEEAFLIFDRMTDFSRELALPQHGTPWQVEAAQPDVWRFGRGLCHYTVRYLPEENTAIISSRCAC